MLIPSHFAVVDVETTGIFSNGNDRIIEIAVIRVDAAGNTLDEFVTLVNPHRDLGLTSLHGIEAKDILSAPLFEEVAGDIVSRLKDAVFTAHNVTFDLGFVKSELSRLGCELPGIPCLCTMRLAQHSDPCIPSRRLADLCEHFALEVSSDHSAYADAKAAAFLLSACARRLGDEFWSLISLPEVGGLERGRWPDLPCTGKAYSRVHAEQDRREACSYLGKLVRKLPVHGVAAPRLDEYFAVLDRVLEDRVIAVDEADSLFQVAQNMGLSRDEAKTGHDLYVRELIAIASFDGEITDTERRDLREVSALLGIAQSVCDAGCDESLRQHAAESHDVQRVRRKPQTEIVGRSICFTGELRSRIGGEMVTRSFAEQTAARKGMVVKKGVTKSLDYLVAADPNSLSGKACKARDYGVRIVAEPVFWQLMGVRVD